MDRLYSLMASAFIIGVFTDLDTKSHFNTFFRVYAPFLNSKLFIIGRYKKDFISEPEELFFIGPQNGPPPLTRRLETLVLDIVYVQYCLYTCSPFYNRRQPRIIRVFPNHCIELFFIY